VTFAATHHPRSLAVTNIVGVIPIVEVVDGWQVEDDGMVVATVLGHKGWEGAAETYARRIAELLERHGIADVPEVAP
jgi:hypothetical protein